MSGTTNVNSNPIIRAVISDLASYIYNNRGSISSSNDVESLIEAYQASIDEPDINLSSLSVDYEANNQLIMSLFNSSAAWLDDIKTGVGTSVARALATMLTYANYNIVRSAQETLLPFATLPSSIYAGTSHLGVRIARSTPCSMTVSLTCSGTDFPYVIPAYTSFSLNGDVYFNRASIIIQSADAVSATLYQGSVNSVSYTATGQPYQSYTFGNSDFAISDEDLIVTINGTQWTRASFNSIFSTGLWNYGSTDMVFIDSTTPDGNVNVSFGNGSYGYVPSASSNIVIQYCTTKGTSGAANYSGLTVSCSASSSITGIVTSNSSGGGDPLSAYDYKSLSPGSYAAKGVGITSDGLNEVVRSYPGVADARVLTQQDFAPDDLTQMMQAKVVILPSTPWGEGQYLVFYNWIQNSCIANMIFSNVNPIAVPMNISAVIYCYTQSDLDDIETRAKAQLINSFQPARGILGYARTLNDIYDLIRASSPKDIDYIDLISPTSDGIPADGTQYITLGSLSITASYTTREKLGGS